MAQTFLSCGSSLPAPAGVVSGLCHSHGQAHPGDGRAHTGNPDTGTSWGHVMALDPQLTPQQPPDADSLWDMIVSALPVVLVSMCTATLYHIKDALKERSWKARWAVILVSASTGAALGPIAVSLAHEYLPGVSCMVHLSIGCFIGTVCPRYFETKFCEWAGLTRVNLRDSKDIDDCKQLMTPEERARHADTCPFESDRYEGRCMQCPHRQHRQHKEE